MNNPFIKISTYKCSCQNEEIYSNDLKKHLNLETYHNISLIKPENIKNIKKSRKKSYSQLEICYSKKYMVFFTFKVISSILIRRSQSLICFLYKIAI